MERFFGIFLGDFRFWEFFYKLGIFWDFWDYFEILGIFGLFEINRFLYFLGIQNSITEIYG